jgi:LmbE family N-acetylglucosaminyl deacetylase
MGKNIVVFAPHPDDETLGCGGTIVKKIKEGYSLFMIFMTNGASGSDYSHYGMTSGLTRQELKEIRKQEAKNACNILGVDSRNLFFLDFEDRTLMKNREAAQEKVTEILRMLSPVEVYFPHKKDQNKDHLATNSTVKRSFENLPKQPVKYQYVIWVSREMSRRARFWISIKDKIRTLGESSNSQVSIDILEFLHLKRKALDEYKSQTTLFFPEQKHTILAKSFLDNFLTGKEVFYLSI